MWRWVAGSKNGSYCAEMGCVPSARVAPHFWLHAASRQLFLWGGDDSERLDDMYSFDISGISDSVPIGNGSSWTAVSQSGNIPLPRRAAAIWNEESAFTLFGGTFDPDAPRTFSSSDQSHSILSELILFDLVYANDQYSFDVSSSTWTRVRANGGTTTMPSIGEFAAANVPETVSDATIVSHPNSSFIFLFGGSVGGAEPGYRLKSLWAFSKQLRMWTRLNDFGPSANETTIGAADPNTRPEAVGASHGTANGTHLFFYAGLPALAAPTSGVPKWWSWQLLCPIGHFVSSSNAADCLQCPLNTSSSTPNGQFSCTPCMDGSYTSAVGSADCISPPAAPPVSAPLPAPADSPVETPSEPPTTPPSLAPSQPPVSEPSDVPQGEPALAPEYAPAEEEAPSDPQPVAEPVLPPVLPPVAQPFAPVQPPVQQPVAPPSRTLRLSISRLLSANETVAVKSTVASSFGTSNVTEVTLSGNGVTPPSKRQSAEDYNVYIVVYGNLIANFDSAAASGFSSLISALSSAVSGVTFSLPVPAPQSPPVAAPAVLPPDSSNANRPQPEALTVGAIAGIAVAAAVVVIGIMIVLVFILRRKKTEKFDPSTVPPVQVEELKPVSPPSTPRPENLSNSSRRTRTNSQSSNRSSPRSNSTNSIARSDVNRTREREYAAVPSKESELKPEWIIAADDLEMDRKIGSGTFGEVWKGKWKKAPVAIKTCRQSERGKLEDFRKEAIFQLGMRAHPNVVQSLGVCVNDGVFNLVTEFCPRGSLDGVFAKGHLSMQRKLKILNEVALGLLHCHALRIVHRDIAARNILLTKDYKAKISDFGMSRQVAGSTIQNTTDSLIGPIRSMAPECISERAYSTRSDVYAFGIMVVEVISEDVPYGGACILRFSSTHF